MCSRFPTSLSPNKVYIAAIAGHVPSEIVKCLSTFMNLCYIFRRNAISSTVLKNAEALLDRFHELRGFFVDAGVRSTYLHIITSSACPLALYHLNCLVRIPKWSMLINYGVETYQSCQGTLATVQPLSGACSNVVHHHPIRKACSSAATLLTPRHAGR
jgi:hypothetical protein